MSNIVQDDLIGLDYSYRGRPFCRGASSSLDLLGLDYSYRGRPYSANAPNVAPVSAAGPDQTIRLPHTAQLAGSATDDGNPMSPGTVTYSWSKVSGAGTVTFTPNNTTANAVASFSAPDTYVLRLTSSDGDLTNTDDVTIIVNPIALSPPRGIGLGVISLGING